MAHRTTIKHGYLSIEFCEDGSLQIVKETNGSVLQLSRTEFEFLMSVVQLRGWPIAPPSSEMPAYQQWSGTSLSTDTQA